MNATFQCNGDGIRRRLERRALDAYRKVRELSYGRIGEGRANQTGISHVIVEPRSRRGINRAKCGPRAETAETETGSRAAERRKNAILMPAAVRIEMRGALRY